MLLHFSIQFYADKYLDLYSYYAFPYAEKISKCVEYFD